MMAPGDVKRSMKGGLRNLKCARKMRKITKAEITRASQVGMKRKDNDQTKFRLHRCEDTILLQNEQNARNSYTTGCCFPKIFNILWPTTLIFCKAISLQVKWHNFCDNLCILCTCASADNWSK